MALGMGLAQNVDDTAKAFQGNPQALQQRYTQKKDLFDLLALNMIKKQQAEAKNALMMSQEKKPGTIIEQMEKELVGNAKTEMGGNTQAETASGVAGALQEKQKDSQQNMQQVANTGVAATPQGNMLNLAGGGIVGFAAGKEVPKADAMYSFNSFGNITKYKKIGDEYFRVKEDGTLAKEAERSGLKLNHLNQGSASPLVEQLAIPFEPIAGAGDAISRDQNSLSGIAAVQPEEKSPMDIMAGGTPTNETKIPDVVPPKVTSSSDKGNFGIEDIAYGGTKVPEGVQNIDRQTQEGITSLLTENKDRTAFTNEMMGDRRKLREEMEGKLKGRGLKEFLLGARGNTLGQTLRSGASASLAADKEADALLRGEFGDINKLGMDEFNKLADIKEKGVAQGREYSKGEKSFAQAEAGQIYDADKTNQSAAAKVAEIKSKEFVSKQDNRVKIDIANMEKEISTKRNSIAERSNEIRATGDLINADILIIKETEALVNMAQKNIGASYDKLILSVNDNVTPPMKTSAEKKIEVQRLQTLKTKLIEERTLQLQNDALQARKRLAKREGMGNKPSGSNTNGFITGSMKVS
jgi:hypothetical protein